MSHPEKKRNADDCLDTCSDESLIDCSETCCYDIQCPVAFPYNCEYNDVLRQCKMSLKRAQMDIADKDLMIAMLKDQHIKMENYCRNSLDETQKMRTKYLAVLEQFENLKKCYAMQVKNAQKPIPAESDNQALEYFLKSEVEKLNKEYKEIVNKIGLIDFDIQKMIQVMEEKTNKEDDCDIRCDLRRIEELITNQDEILKLLTTKVAENTSAIGATNQMKHFTQKCCLEKDPGTSKMSQRSEQILRKNISSNTDHTNFRTIHTQTENTASELFSSTTELLRSEEEVAPDTLKTRDHTDSSIQRSAFKSEMMDDVHRKDSSIEDMDIELAEMDEQLIKHEDKHKLVATDTSSTKTEEDPEYFNYTDEVCEMETAGRDIIPINKEEGSFEKMQHAEGKSLVPYAEAQKMNLNKSVIGLTIEELPDCCKTALPDCCKLIEQTEPEEKEDEEDIPYKKSHETHSKSGEDLSTEKLHDCCIMEIQYCCKFDQETEPEERETEGNVPYAQSQEISSNKSVKDLTEDEIPECCKLPEKAASRAKPQEMDNNKSEKEIPDCCKIEPKIIPQQVTSATINDQEKSHQMIFNDSEKVLAIEDLPDCAVCCKKDRKDTVETELVAESLDAIHDAPIKQASAVIKCKVSDKFTQTEDEIFKVPTKNDNDMLEDRHEEMIVLKDFTETLNNKLDTIIPFIKQEHSHLQELQEKHQTISEQMRKENSNLKTTLTSTVADLSSNFNNFESLMKDMMSKINKTDNTIENLKKDIEEIVVKYENFDALDNKLEFQAFQDIMTSELAALKKSYEEGAGASNETKMIQKSCYKLKPCEKKRAKNCKCKNRKKGGESDNEDSNPNLTYTVQTCLLYNSFPFLYKFIYAEESNGFSGYGTTKLVKQEITMNSRIYKNDETILRNFESRYSHKMQ